MTEGGLSDRDVRPFHLFVRRIQWSKQEFVWMLGIQNQDEVTFRSESGESLSKLPLQKAK